MLSCLHRLDTNVLSHKHHAAVCRLCIYPQFASLLCNLFWCHFNKLLINYYFLLSFLYMCTCIDTSMQICTFLYLYH